MMKRDWPVLFREYDLRAVLEAQLKSVDEGVRGIPEAEFDARTDDYLAATVASKLVVSPVELLESKVSVMPREAKIDVSHDPNRHFFEPGPHYVDGLEITYHLPFTGDGELFKCAPNQLTAVWPRAFVERGELRFPYDAPNRDVAATKVSFERDLSELKKWLSWVDEQVDEYNSALEPRVRQAVVNRRAEVSKTQADIAALGYAIHGQSTSEESGAERSPTDMAAAREEKRQATRREYDVALSFAGEDREYVDSVAEHLTALGVSVFYDRFEQVNLWGKELAEHLGDVYSKDSHFVVMFASRHYAEKAWPSHERQFALSRHLKGDTGRILPVRFDDTEIPGLPGTVAYLDARVVTAEKLAELIRQKVDME